MRGIHSDFLHTDGSNSVFPVYPLRLCVGVVYKEAKININWTADQQLFLTQVLWV